MKSKFTLRKSGVTGMLLIFMMPLKLFAQTDATNTSTEPAVVNSPNGGSEKFLAPGFASTVFQWTKSDGSPAMHTFTPIGIAAFPIVKFNDRLFLDCAATLTANADGSATAGIGELVGFYKINPYITAFFGNFSPHYGVFLGILDDFTNRFGTGVDPVGMGHALQNQTGLGIQGGIQAGYSKFTYQLYVANGPQLLFDSATTRSAGNTTGQLDYGPYVDNNNNKSVGWHVGFLPFSNSCLELTFSGEYAAKTGATGTAYEGVSATSWALGLNYYHLFSPVMVRVIAEYDQVQVKNYNYPIATDSGTTTINKFDNQQNGWFAGATIRLAGSKQKIVRNFELAARQGGYNPPKDAPWGGNPTNQTTFCLTYYLTWAIPLSFEYDILTQDGAPKQNIFSTILFFRF